MRDLRELVREALIADYDPSAKSGGYSLTPIHEWGTEQVMGVWEKHVKNRYELMFYLKNGTVDEKLQASKELEVCDRKMAFWERHANFDPVEANSIAGALAKEWEMPAIKLKQPMASRPTTTKLGFTSSSVMPAPGTAGAQKVMHKTFGTGTIVKKLDGDKVMVIFDDKKLGGVAKTLSMSFLKPM